MRRLSIWCRIYLGLAAFSVLGSVLTQVARLDPGPIAPLAAALTLLVGVVAVYEPLFVRLGSKKGLICFLCILGIGATAEIVGIHTGWPFGRYEYTDRWWPVVFLPGGQAFPLLVPFAWALVVGGVFSLVRSQTFGPFVLTAALGTTLVDLLTEKALVEVFRFWRWLEPATPLGAPALNFLGWFAVSALALAVVWRLGARPTNAPEPRFVLYGHLAMVILISIVSTLMPAMGR